MWRLTRFNNQFRNYEFWIFNFFNLSYCFWQKIRLLSTTDETCPNWSRNLWTLYFLNSIWGNQLFNLFSCGNYWKLLNLYWFWPYFEKKGKLFKGRILFNGGSLKGNTAFSFGVSKLVVGSDKPDNLFHETYVLLHKGSGPIVYRAAALRSHLIK